MSMNMTAEKNAPAFDTSVTIAGVTLKNPVMTASGTFGSGAEYSEFVDLNKLGAVVTKGVANVPWPGNPTPRIAETHSGMLNAIGLQNPGIDLFCKRDIPYLKQFDTKIIVNVCGRSTEDYLEVVERLGNEPVDMLEINISTGSFPRRMLICLRLTFPAQMLKRAELLLDRIQRQLRQSQRL